MGAHAAKEDAVAKARRWAKFYRERGYNPLPSRSDVKRPPVAYSQWWESPVPESLFDEFPTTNIQVMTGRYWGLLVIDLDGDEAKTKFTEMGGRYLPPTWETNSGGGGTHLWFSIPRDYPKPLPKAILWKGESKHSAIERLCDRSLIMAPPSIHPERGTDYKFASSHHSPARIPLPACCPAWLLNLPPINQAVESPKFWTAPIPTERPREVKACGFRYDADEVLDAIRDKVGLARSWGVRVASDRPNAAGWMRCHALGREDRTPSASFSEATGSYWEPGMRVIGFFSLAVVSGAYPDVRSAIVDLGDRYLRCVRKSG